MYQVTLDFHDNASPSVKKVHTPLEVDRIFDNWRTMLGFEASKKITITIEEVLF